MGANLNNFSTDELRDELLRRLSIKPEWHCSSCGIDQENEPDGLLTDVRVIVASGEEGFADITQMLCGECLEERLGGLRELGFEDHRHGGINYLEAPCVSNAYHNCPSPTGYGRVFVGNESYNEE